MSSPREDHRCERHDHGPAMGQNCQRKGQSQKTRSEGQVDHEDQVHAMDAVVEQCAGRVKEGKKEERILTTPERPPIESSVLRPSCTLEFMSSKS